MNPTKDPAARLLADHDDQERRPFHVVLCARSYKALQSFADNNGCTMTGLIDALGHHMEHTDETDADDIARAARSFDVERRRKRFE